MDRLGSICILARPEIGYLQWSQCVEEAGDGRGAAKFRTLSDVLLRFHIDITGWTECYHYLSAPSLVTVQFFHTHRFLWAAIGCRNGTSHVDIDSVR